MTRSSALALVTLIVLSFVGVALARDVSGVHFDEQVTLDGTTLVLNGAGVRHVTIFGIEVYAAGLYVPAATHDATVVLDDATPRELVAVMKRDVGSDQIGPAFREAIERAAGTPSASLRAEIASFASWLPAMRERDRLVVTYSPEHGLVVRAPSASAPFHGSAALARAVFGMWLGTHPVEDSLRAALLGS